MIVTIKLPDNDLHSAAPLYMAMKAWLAENCAESYGIRLVEMGGPIASADVEFTSTQDATLFALRWSDARATVRRIGS